jgi:hypothetical protein
VIGKPLPPLKDLLKWRPESATAGAWEDDICGHGVVL